MGGWLWGEGCCTRGMPRTACTCVLQHNTPAPADPSPRPSRIPNEADPVSRARAGAAAGGGDGALLGDVHLPTGVPAWHGAHPLHPRLQPHWLHGAKCVGLGVGEGVCATVAVYILQCWIESWMGGSVWLSAADAHPAMAAACCWPLPPTFAPPVPPPLFSQIASYMMRMLGFNVPKALQRFAEKRPPGIYKHYYIR